MAAGLCASPVTAAERYVSGNIGISAMSDVNFLLTSELAGVEKPISILALV